MADSDGRTIDRLIEDTADGVYVYLNKRLKTGTLYDWYVQIQGSAGAGTFDVEVMGPAGVWTSHRTGRDSTINDHVSLSSGPSEVYKDARVKFVASTGTNILGIHAERRVY